jgi:hypothetical protein
VQRQVELHSDVSDELLVFVGFGPANAMIQVDDADYDAEFGSQFQQRPQKGHAVGTTGDGDAHAIACTKESVGSDIALERRKHAEMLQLNP